MLSPWIRSFATYHASPPNSAPSPGRRNHPFKVPEQGTAAWVETVASTSTMEPRVPDGPRHGIVSFGNKDPRTKEAANLMRLKNRLMSPGSSPVCRCSVCASRRTTQLTQALQDKFGSLTLTRRIQ